MLSTSCTEILLIHFFLIHLFVMATWKNKDRCGKWYSGHAVPSLAVCEGETDVNELLSFG